MITVTLQTCDREKSLFLSVRGHAGQDRCGHDLVCAAASILTFTVCEAVSRMQDAKRLKSPSYYTMEPGNAEILCKLKTAKEYETMKTVFCTAEIGYTLLETQYPMFLHLQKMTGQQCLFIQESPTLQAERTIHENH